MGSRAPEVVAAIYSRVSAAAPADVRVYDGPEASADPSDAIHLGYNADPDAPNQPVRTTSEWAGLGAKKRTERIEIDGAIYLLGGADDVAGARARGYALLAVVEDALHSAPGIGVAPPTWAWVSSSQLMYPSTYDDAGNYLGLEVWIGFTITIATRPG